jgi:hypothetical protein
LPLLGGITTDEGFIKRPADESDYFIFQVARGTPGILVTLQGEEGARFVGRQNLSKETADRAKVNRHRINLAAMHRENVVAIIGERREAVQVAPDFLTVTVKQVRAIFMRLNPRLRIDRAMRVSATMAAPLENQDLKPQFRCRLMRNSQAVKAGTDDNQVAGGKGHQRGSGRIESEDSGLILIICCSNIWTQLLGGWAFGDTLNHMKLKGMLCFK